jgi:predicted O-methyltransferase YrrM
MTTLDQVLDRLTAIEPPRRYDPFSRKLVKEELFYLHEQWTPKLGLDWCEKSHIRYWHHRLVNIEQMCAGRMAGDVREAVLRVMVAAAVQDSDFRMLEIGTLFGVNTAATWEIATGLHDTAHITIIDPLDGYYGAKRRDPATGLQVSRKLVDLNLRRIGLPAESLCIIQGLSDAPAVITKASTGRYSYMFIDGDHTYEGVKKDWQTYRTLLDPGGYVIFDNYRDASWPEVTQFVDELIASEEVEYLGHAWQTAVFRQFA